MDPIKDAFSKIKEEISILHDEIYNIKDLLSVIKNQTDDLQNIVTKIQQTNSPTHNPTHKQPLEPISGQNTHISIRNEGVPTDKQTDRQTDRQTQNHHKSSLNDPIQEFRHANEILSTLDSIKKGIRIKFKGLTNQEMAVFSALYALEDQNISEITYRTLATKIKLSESSIREYITKLIKKGIPINKIKQNNKTIHLKISKDLKNITTLQTILELRDI
ncbi:MAG: hypothetical protein IH845_02435 [Nanoarchaeota archaeon]|nr:hypothetical protein [Nanoarchaeota archaeon]